MDASEQIRKFSEYFETRHNFEILEALRTGQKFFVVDFLELSKFDPELSDVLLDEPENVIRAAEIAVEQFDVEGSVKGFKVRFKNLPASQLVMIKDIRAEHIGRFLAIIGLVRQKSDVRPKVTIAKFECPSCGNIITVPQLDTTFKEPYKCGCGRKGKFRLLSKELVDAQRIVLEESPEDLEGGEQPKRMGVFLERDLVSPLSEKKTNPGSKILVNGVVNETPIIESRTGTKSTRFELFIESNYVEAREESYGDIIVSPEEEAKIKELSEDKNLFPKMVNSIAPSIYGHDKIKEALVLQLMAGVRKKRSDGAVNRGDIHILLIGDPGCIAGDSQIALAYKGMEQIQNLGNRHLQPIKEIVTKIRKHSKDKPYDFATVFHHYKNQPVLKVITETGKEVVCTYNQPFLTKTGWQRADEMLPGTEIRVMPKIPNHIKNLAPTGFTKVEKKTGLLKKVSIPDKFTPELASLCGYIAGDGNIHPNGYRVTLYVNDEEKDLISKLSNLCMDAFSIQPSLITKTASTELKSIDDGNGLLRQFISKQTMYLLEINSRQIACNLSFLSNKRVPQQIFKSPKKVIARFISWLFEADGCAFGKGRGRISIQLKSSQHELLRDVQLLLLYFGIQSRIIEDNLCIRRSRDMELFAEHIGFNSQKKKMALNRVLGETKLRNNMQKRKTPQRYERITQILPAGITDVYDFEVPVSHTFIANGIVCHNSGKSQLLKRITNVAPKARYVSGKGASAAGLTASVVKDEFMKGWSLEAGALPLTNRGICMIDELDKMTKEDREAMHEALEQQCMLPDFKLMLSDGNYVEIGKYVDNLMEQNKKKVYKGINCEILPVKTAELLSTDFKSHFPARAARVSRHKAPGQFIKIELTNGRIISVTPEHPCWVVENGRITTIPAEKLTRNMFFPIPSEIKIRSRKYEQKNNDLCKILGYHLSDGCYELNRGKKNGIQFWNNDETLIKDYKKSVEKFFKVKPIITRRKHQFAVRVISKRVLEEIGKMSGDLLEKGPVKKIPDEIMQLPNENLRYLLRTLFDGDGTVVFQKRNGCRVSLVSQNREMMEQSSDLLLRFGIQSSIFRDRRGNVWKLDVSGQENLNKFLAEIGFLSRHKKQRLTQYCRINKTYRTIKDVVPNCTDKISELFKRAGISAKKEIGHQIDLGVEKHRLFLQKLVRIAVKKTMHFDGKEWRRIKAELMDIEKLAFGYARWNKIKKVSKIKNNKIKWVYDVTIEPHHAFISNGMILHNTVSIAKANIQATLRCETTVLAAANPKFGRFNPYEPIAGQIDLPPALINRFDLIFPIKDLPSPDKDEKMAKFILALHKEGTVGYDIETSLLRKYIAYAKQNFNPVLTESAFEELKEYYLKMRASGSTEGSVATIPISARQLEALVRLAEAAAKLRLSDKVQKRDAKKAVELLHYCLTEVGMDRETGKIDIDRIATGITATQRSKIGIVREIIAELENKIGKTIPVEDIMREAAARNVDEDDVEEVIDKLKRSGDIFEPKRGFVQRIY